MNKFRDKELGRLLTNADDLLANITVYETPAEETARKQEEARFKSEEEARLLQEELRKAEERKAQEEARRLQEEQHRAEERKCQEEEQRLQEEQHRAEERKCQEEEQRFQEEQHRAEERKRQEEEQYLLEAQSSLFSIICFVFMEMIVHLSIYRNVDTRMVYPVLFAAGFGCMAALVSSFFPKRWNTILFCLILILYSLYCDLQILYHAVSGAFLPLAGMQESIWTFLQDGAALQQGVTTVLPWLVVMFLPLLLWAVAGRKWIRFERSNWQNRLIAAVAGIIVIVVGILCLDMHGYEAESPYVCFYHFDSETRLESSGKQLGVTMTTGLELLELFQRQNGS